jgi:hypothetical protein
LSEIKILPIEQGYLVTAPDGKHYHCETPAQLKKKIWLFLGIKEKKKA